MSSPPHEEARTASTIPKSLGWRDDRQARSELEHFLKEQPENYTLLGDLALTDAGLGDKAAALTLAERAVAVNPIEKDAIDDPVPLEFLARAAAQACEPDRAIAALEKLLSIPYAGPPGCNAHSCGAPA